MRESSMCVLVSVLMIALAGTASAAGGDLDSAWSGDGRAEVLQGDEVKYYDIVYANPGAYTTPNRAHPPRYIAVGSVSQSGVLHPIITAFDTSGSVVWSNIDGSVTMLAAGGITAGYRTRGTGSTLEQYFVVYYAIETTNSWVVTARVYDSIMPIGKTKPVAGSVWRNFGARTISFPQTTIPIPAIDIENSDGVLTVVGGTRDGVPQPGLPYYSKATVARMNLDTGALVDGFGSGGIYKTVLASGAIFTGYNNGCAVGQSNMDNEDIDTLIACFDAQGETWYQTLSFGDATRIHDLGRSIMADTTTVTIAASVCNEAPTFLQPDDCILGFARIQRMSGAPDSGFSDGPTGTPGIARYALPGSAGKKVQLGCNNLVRVGYRTYATGQFFSSTGPSSFMFAILSDGRKDNNFDGDGLKTFSPDEAYTGMTILDTGITLTSRIVVAGYTTLSGVINGLVTMHFE